MSTPETIKQLKEQLNSSLTDKQKQLTTEIAESNKAVKCAKQQLKDARLTAKAAKEAAKAAKDAVALAKASHQTIASKLEASFTAKQIDLKTQLTNTQRELMSSRMGK